MPCLSLGHPLIRSRNLFCSSFSQGGEGVGAVRQQPLACPRLRLRSCLAAASPARRQLGRHLRDADGPQRQGCQSRCSPSTATRSSRPFHEGSSGGAAQVQGAAEPAAPPGLRALRAATASAKAKSRSAPTSRAASRSSSLSDGGADAGGREANRWSRTIPGDAQCYQTARDQDEDHSEAGAPRGKDKEEALRAEDHDISEGDVEERDEHDEIWDEDDWTAGLPTPEEAGRRGLPPEADAGRLPPGGNAEWKEEEPSAPPDLSSLPASGADSSKLEVKGSTQCFLLKNQ